TTFVFRQRGPSACPERARSRERTTSPSARPRLRMAAAFFLADRSTPVVTDPLSPRRGVRMSRSDKPTLPIAPGSQFGPYPLVRQLRGGGFAEVWEAERHDGTGSIALKILSAARDVEQSALERFVQEGRIAAALSHPRTVYVFSAEQVGTLPVIA